MTVQADLEEWLMFCDVGSTIYIRAVNDVHEVAYYQLQIDILIIITKLNIM